MSARVLYHWRRILKLLGPAKWKRGGHQDRSACDHSLN
jgi:hypothetical protein